jgi:DNA-binding transcriptional LysR family regulator
MTSSTRLPDAADPAGALSTGILAGRQLAASPDAPRTLSTCPLDEHVHVCNTAVQECAPMDLPWDDVRVLLALLRTKSLAGAGRALGVDRSTMSRRVASLERALGAKLFLRTRDGLRPAAAAERLRAQAERVEAEMRAFERAATAREDQISGVVRVAATEAFGAFLVERGLLDLRRDHPGVVVELIGGNRPVDIARGEADIALRLVPLQEAALKARCVARLGFGLYSSPSYLKERGTPRAEADLDGHDVLVPGGELSQLPEAKWLASQPGVRIAFRSTSMPAIHAACAAGHGLAVLTRPWGELTPALTQVFPIEELPRRPLWLVVQPDVAKRPEVRVVVERIGAIADGLTRA